MLPKSTVAVELVTNVAGVAALGPCYERLLQATGNTMPFALHEWHLAWCRPLPELPLAYPGRAPVLCLARSGGACVAIFPFIISRRRLGPFKIVSIDLLGADPAITEIRTPLIYPGYEQLAARAVQHHLKKAGRWDWIHWTGIDAAFAEALAANGRLQWQPPQSDFVLDLPPTWEEFRSGPQAQYPRIAAPLLQLVET